MEHSQSEAHPLFRVLTFISCFRIVDFDIPSLFLNGNVSAPSMFSNLKSISLVRNIISKYYTQSTNYNFYIQGRESVSCLLDHDSCQKMQP